MTAYGIYVGIAHEGGRVLPIMFYSYKEAKENAKKEINEMEDPDWDLSKFEKVHKDKWTNGIDIVEIQKFIIK